MFITALFIITQKKTVNNIFIHRQRDKQTAVHLYHGLLLYNKFEQTTDTTTWKNVRIPFRGFWER